MYPIVLGPNQPAHFYRGGARIVELRGAGSGTLPQPEDWVASTTTRFGDPEQGLTRLPDGGWLRDAIAADAHAWLGPDHVDRYGADPALLVKLLDAGQRLPVHCHPDRPFAASHLASRYGKTEAWIVLAADPDATVHLGFAADVPADRLRAWVDTQDARSMLAATNQVPVRAGDAIVVPAGLPHAIGSGIFVVELQEPTDFSVLLEWTEFAPHAKDADASDANLNLGWDLAMQCVDRRAWSRDRVESELRRRTNGSVAEVAPVFDPGTDRYFRAERIRPRQPAECDASFAVLVVVDGAGELRHAAGVQPLHRGQTLVVPWATGSTTVSGSVDVIRALPPIS